MKVILFTLGIFVSFNASAEWDNPSERYLNAYKMYEDAKCPIPPDSIKHFVYFARDREAIRKHPFLNHSRWQLHWANRFNSGDS